jgi:hypothetical protein
MPLPLRSWDDRVVGTVTRAIIVPKKAAAKSVLLTLFIERFMKRYYIKKSVKESSGTKPILLIATLFRSDLSF